MGKAKEIIKLIDQAAAEVKAELVEQWQSTSMRDVDERETIYYQMRLTNSVVDAIKVKAEVPIMSEVTNE